MFNCKRIVTIAAVVVLACTAFGQGQGRGFGMFGRGGPQMGAMLLRRPDVQNDLKLTDDQKTKLTDIQSSMGEKMRSVFQDSGGDRTKMQELMKPIMDDMNKQVNAVLTDAQQTRLKQIGIQLAGNGAAGVPEVQTQLGLTDDQKAKIKDLQKTANDANMAVGEKMRNQEIDRDAAMAAFKKNTDALNDEIAKVLTDAQKAKLKELGGPAFTADPPGGL